MPDAGETIPQPFPNDPDSTDTLRTEDLARRQALIDTREGRVGPYRLLETIGEGGFGTVYLAEQTEPIRRRVALKIIKAGMDTKQVIARFEAERQALAMMNHPNVAKVFDAGTTDQGRPYFAMEYVAGIAITEYCDKHRLNTEERLRLFMDVCHAIQHAHQKGIIHRDIKPSNVLVAVDASAPPLAKGGVGGVQVKVIDFGVAKATQHRLTERTLFTEQGQLIGTPGYMSPEQAEMTALDIDTRTDVYSLGVLLYELLVGALPFDTKTLLQAGFAEIQRIIREVDPPKPSTRLSAMASAVLLPEPSPSGGGHPRDVPARRDGGSEIDTIAHHRHTEPKTLIRQIRGDLDWIIMRAMEKDRTRRYETANGMALEIQRYLNSEPVLAGPPSGSYRLGKFVRRNRTVVFTTAVVFLAILAGAIVSTRMYVRAEAARYETVLERDRAIAAEDEAHARRSEAEAVLRFLGQMIEMFDPAKSLGRDVTVRELLDRWASKISDEGKYEAVVEAALHSMFGEAYRSLGEYDLAEQHIRRALGIRRARLGDKDSAVAVTMLTLGTLLFDKGDYENADAFIAQGNGLLLGHRSGVDSLNIEAAAAMSRRDFRQSEMLYRRDLEARRARFGPNHVEVGDAFYNLGVVLCRMGEFREAERMYRDALEIRRNLPHDHPDFAYSLLALGDLLVKTRRSAEAESLLREALQISRKVLPKKHWQIPLTEATLGECLAALGRYEEAESLLLASYPEISRVQGVDNRLYTADALNAIIKLYELWDAAEPGKDHAEKAAEWREKLEEEATERRSDEATKGKGSGEVSPAATGAKGTDEAKKGGDP